MSTTNTPVTGRAPETDRDAKTVATQETATRSDTNTPLQFVRKNIAWIVIAAIVLGVTLFTFTNQPTGDVTSFSSQNTRPNGSMAVAEVLKNQGVNVVAVDNFDDLQRLSAGNTAAQILLIDPQNQLRPEYLRQLQTMTNRLIFLQPGFNQLAELGLTGNVLQAGSFSNKPLNAQRCTLGDDEQWLRQAINRAGLLSPDSTGYRTFSSQMTGCVTNEDATDVYSLLVVNPRSSSAPGTNEIIILGHYGLLQNQTILLDGNASLALSLLGKEKTLYWYMPTYVDSATGEPTLADLTPPWVTPIIVLLLMTAVAYALYSGRRMGPLVAEKLPVTVPANETVEGRARLYQHSQSLDHVLNQLRMGTLARLAKTLGVSRNNNYQLIVMQAAAVTGQSVQSIDTLLVTGRAGNENTLMKMSDELLKLEQAVVAAVKI